MNLNQRKSRKVLLLAGAGVLLASAIAVPLTAQEPPRPPLSRTRIETVSKVVRGEERKVRDITRACTGGSKTRSMLFEITAAQTSFECDDPCSRETLNGTLRMQVEVTRREDAEKVRRGCFGGRWTLVHPTTNAILASGSLKGTVNAGTHNSAIFEGENWEDCALRGRFKGILEGQSLHPRCRGPLCLSIEGKGLDPELPQFQMRAEGMVTLPCVNEPVRTSR